MLKWMSGVSRENKIRNLYIKDSKGVDSIESEIENEIDCGICDQLYGEKRTKWLKLGKKCMLIVLKERRLIGKFNVDFMW